MEVVIINVYLLSIAFLIFLHHLVRWPSVVAEYSNFGPIECYIS